MDATYKISEHHAASLSDDLVQHGAASYSTELGLQPGGLRPHLSVQEAAFARALKTVHDELKLATMVVGGAVILYSLGRFAPEQFAARLEEAARTYQRGVTTLRGLRPPPRDSRKRAYLAAAVRAQRAVATLREALDVPTSKTRQARIRRASDRLAAAHGCMRAIGETFWYPEYVPLISEGVFHTH